MNNLIVDKNTVDDNSLPSHVVGIGASAGGLEALERFFRAAPTNSGMAFVVVQHLSPDFKSMMNELLERFTKMPAINVHDTMEVQSNTIYLLPPKKDLTIEGNLLVPRDRVKDGSLSLPINIFFRSLAASWGERAISIVLSGTGSDGSNGILDIRDAGGMVLVETPETARFDGMPQSAINTGCVDAILPPEEMHKAILSFGTDPATRHHFPDSDIENAQPGLPGILNLLKKHYYIDFGSYKPATITRRIERRVTMGLVDETLEQYSQRLLNDADELNLLYKDLLIGVTRFFRDPEAFSVLRETVIPKLIEEKDPDKEMRVWVCACSTGEEAYSIAILFLEAFEKAGRKPNMKVLATDLHEDSIQKASEGIYAEEALQDMPIDLRLRYFEEVEKGRFRVLQTLRKHLIFSQLNILKDPPFTRMDFVTCRNLLIYFQPVAQARSIATLHYALNLGGVMFLGASESLGEFSGEMETLDRLWKIFRKHRPSNLLLQLRSPMSISEVRSLRSVGSTPAILPRVYDLLLELFIPCGFLINDRREALHFFGDAHKYVKLTTGGRFNSDITELVPHDMALALAAAIRSAEKQKIPVILKGVSLSNGNLDGGHELLNISAIPLYDKSSNFNFFMIKIEQHQTKNVEIIKENTVTYLPDLESSGQLRDLEAELLRLRESLQTTVEELETTNEELQASNEELLAANEELQSTNEELHSVNEELFSVNSEYELKIDELNRISSDLKNLIQSTDTATIFVDLEFRIRLFTPQALNYFNFLYQDIGRDMRHFKQTVNDENLYSDMNQILLDNKPIERNLSWKGGTAVRRCSVYYDDSGKSYGFVINYFETTAITEYHEQLSNSEAMFKTMINAIPNSLLVLDNNGKIILANNFTENMMGHKVNDLVGKPLDILCSEANICHPCDILNEFFKNSDKEIKPMFIEGLIAKKLDGSEFKSNVSISNYKHNDSQHFLFLISESTSKLS